MHLHQTYACQGLVENWVERGVQFLLDILQQNRIPKLDGILQHPQVVWHLKIDYFETLRVWQIRDNNNTACQTQKHTNSLRNNSSFIIIKNVFLYIYKLIWAEIFKCQWSSSYLLCKKYWQAVFIGSVITWGGSWVCWCSEFEMSCDSLRKVKGQLK